MSRVFSSNIGLIWDNMDVWPVALCKACKGNSALVKFAAPLLYCLCQAPRQDRHRLGSVSASTSLPQVMQVCLLRVTFGHCFYGQRKFLSFICGGGSAASGQNQLGQAKVSITEAGDP